MKIVAKTAAAICSTAALIALLLPLIQIAHKAQPVTKPVPARPVVATKPQAVAPSVDPDEAKLNKLRLTSKGSHSITITNNQ